MLTQAGRDVGVVVADGHRPRPETRLRQLSGGVAGVQVAGHDLGFESVKAQVVVQRAPLVGQARGVVQVADVLRQHALAVAQQGKGILEVAAERQHARRAIEAGGQRQRRRCVAACASHHAKNAIDHTAHAVVDAALDHPVMVQHVVQLRAQAGCGIGQRNGLRFIAEVAAGQHDGGLAPPHQQVVQWGGRQHGAQPWQPRRDALGQHGRSAWQQHDRRCGTAERSGGGGVHSAPGAQLVQVACHQCERFGFAPLQRAQPGHRRRVASVTGQLVTAQALDE